MIAKAQQTARSVVASNGVKIGFYEYKPKDYVASKKYPLIIFLHGIGERGNGTTDLSRVCANAIPRLINAGNTMTFTNPNTGKQETFLVLSPQLDVMYGSWETFYVDEMLKYAKKNLSVDEKRVFLTGLSLGGGGVWKYATTSFKNASQFAGIIPCCGTGEGTYYCNLSEANVAVWAFHAMDDGVVGVGNTQYAQIKMGLCSPDIKPKFTYYPYGGHGVWEWAFDPGHGLQNPNVYEWMLSLSKKTERENNDIDEDDDSDDKGKAPVNMSPVADAGDNFSTTQNFAYLSAGASYDPDGSIKSFQWTELSGPNAAEMIGANTMFATVKDLVTGTYVFKVVVTDNSGASSSATVKLSVKTTPNKAPVADAGKEVNLILPNSATILDGSASYDPDGSIVSFEWKKLSGPSAGSIVSPSAKSTQLTNLTTGVYVYQLTVTDEDGRKDSDEVKVIVIGRNSNNRPPYCYAGDDFTSSGNYVYLSAGASYDLDGKIVSYAWSQLSGPNKPTVIFGNTMFPIVENVEPGTYVYKLVVTDDEGASAASQVTFKIIAGKNVKQSDAITKSKISGEVSVISEAVSITPNPALIYINVNVSAAQTGKVKLTIYDAQGKTQKSVEYNKEQFDFQQQVNVSGFAQGMYYLQVQIDGRIISEAKRFVKM